MKTWLGMTFDDYFEAWANHALRKSSYLSLQERHHARETEDAECFAKILVLPVRLFTLRAIRKIVATSRIQRKRVLHVRQSRIHPS
ncbi:hypothetical protein PTKU15_84940 [Paraburkholderia terrae]|nr:hypothetical protein PTKU15_84940 [Paraburkholderia terrae]